MLWHQLRSHSIFGQHLGNTEVVPYIIKPCRGSVCLREFFIAMKGFFISLGNGCSCSQLGLFCSTVGTSVIFKFLPFSQFLRLPLVCLWAFSCKVSWLVTVATPILVFIHCFTRHSGSFGSGAFVKLSSRGPTTPREASSVMLKLASRLVPVIILVSTKPSSSLL